MKDATKTQPTASSTVFWKPITPKEKSWARHRTLWMVAFALAILALLITGCGPQETIDNGFIQDSGHDVQWEPHRLPQTLKLSVRLPEWIPPLKEAAKFWESEVGRTVFILDDIPGGLGAPIEPNVIYIEPCAYTDIRCQDHPRSKPTFYKDTGKLIAVEMFIGPDTNLSLIERYHIARHELGHALGLAHDIGRDSIMQGSLSELNDSGTLLRVTGDDRARLRAAYHPE